MMTDEQLDRIPKYAADEVLRLRRELARAKERLRVEHPGTEVRIVDYADGDIDLPPGSQVAFDVDGGRICVRAEGGRLLAYMNRHDPFRTDGYMDVFPGSSNTLSLGVARDRVRPESAVARERMERG